MGFCRFKEMDRRGDDMKAEEIFTSVQETKIKLWNITGKEPTSVTLSEDLYRKVKKFNKLHLITMEAPSYEQTFHGMKLSIDVFRRNYISVGYDSRCI